MTIQQTSKSARADIIASGQVASHCEQVRFALEQLGEPSTYQEIAAIAQLDKHETMKRLADLKDTNIVEHGPKRVCLIGKKSCVTWRLVPVVVKAKRVSLFD